MMRFNGSSGRKPSTEARRYVYACIAAALDNGTERSGGGWFGLGQDADEFDRRRLHRALNLVRDEMLRKARQ